MRNSGVVLIVSIVISIIVGIYIFEECSTYDDLNEVEKEPGYVNTNVTKVSTPVSTPVPTPMPTVAPTKEPDPGPQFVYTGKTTKKSYKWKSCDGNGTWTLELYVSNDEYDYCKQLSRECNPNKYSCYVNNEYDTIAKQIAGALLKQEGKGFTKSDLAREAINFIQNEMTYQSDKEGKGVSEYPKYPVETVMEGRGDCEDLSLLTAAVLKEMGFATGIVSLPGHCCAVIKGNKDMKGAYYEINGNRYFYIECTNTGWDIGEIPKDYRNVSSDGFALF